MKSMMPYGITGLERVKSQWLLYVTTIFKIKKNSTLCPQKWIDVFCVARRTHSHYFSVQRWLVL